MSAWLHVVGLGADGVEGLAGPARSLVEHAELLVGGQRHLSMVRNDAAQKIVWEFPLDNIVSQIDAARDRRVVVLATGDPMSFGIGSTLTRHFAPEDMSILPAPGAFSLAAARLGWPLHACTCLTLHGRPLELLHFHLLPERRLLILSHDGSTPGRLADILRSAGFGPSILHVFENMGAADESVRHGIAQTWREDGIADLNTIGVECLPGPDARYHPPVPGLPDDAFVHDGQMTKRVVRAVTVSALAPMPDRYLWDLGAGCGSVAIEWLRAAQDVQGQGARATAVERDPDRAAMMAQNAARLGTPFLDIVTADISSTLADLDDPDAVFIGGGLADGDLVDTAWARLRPGGHMVANAVTLEGEQALFRAHNAHGGELSRIAVSHAEPVGRLTGWRSAMPVTQWQAVKP
ncbi:MAG: precorrin-6y C5,15-methyltransferase (decarboxylating) subunit CbiE [Alphaproteobacteria bacterium]|nr:precorrin-6y C5,15-methyltransferase (decarboxylating) subunit CbiE [Alphaproteobacteria bacterium]